MYVVHFAANCIHVLSRIKKSMFLNIFFFLYIHLLYITLYYIILYNYIMYYYIIEKILKLYNTSVLIDLK